MAYLGAGATGTVAVGAGTGKPAIYSATPTVTSITLGSGTALTTYQQDTYTPVLSFGGGTTGITYATQKGTYTQIGNIVFVRITISLSNKGSSTGIASITLPVTAAGTDVLALDAANLTFAGNYVDFITFGNSPLIRSLVTAGAVTNLTDTAFANNTNLIISGVYSTTADA